MIDVGIAGCGWGAYYHGKSIVEEYSDKFKLVAFCDLNKEKLDKACSDFKVKGYQNFGDFLADKEIDLVIVATRPHSTHSSLVIQALESGKNVVVEKPMAITSKEAGEMIAARNRTKKVLTVHQNRRWDVDYLNVKQVVEEKTLGELRVIKSFYPGSLGKCDFIYEWGSHFIDQALRLAGGLPAKVVGTLAYPDEEWSKQGFFSAFLYYPNGLTIEVSAFPQAKPFLLPRFYLLGTEGSLVHDWVQRREDAILKHMHFQNAEKGAQFHFFQPKKYQTYPWKITTFYENIYEVLTEGKDLAVKAGEGLETVMVTEAIIESARRNQESIMPGDKN